MWAGAGGGRDHAEGMAGGGGGADGSAAAAKAGIAGGGGRGNRPSLTGGNGGGWSLTGREWWRVVADRGKRRGGR